MMKKYVYHILRKLLKRNLIAPAQLVPRRWLSAVFVSREERNEWYCDAEQAFRVQLDDAEMDRAETFGGRWWRT